MEHENVANTDGENGAATDTENGVATTAVGETMETAAEGATASAPVGFVCNICGVSFTRKGHRDRHVRSRHNNIVPVHDCVFCGAFFNSVAKLKEHRQSHRPSTGFELKSSAFRKKCSLFRKTYAEKMPTFEHAFAADKEDMLRLIAFEVAERKSMKVGVIYHIAFAKLQPQLRVEETAPAADGQEVVEQFGGGMNEGGNSEGEIAEEDDSTTAEEQFGGVREGEEEEEELEDIFTEDPADAWERENDGWNDPENHTEHAPNTEHEVVVEGVEGDIPVADAEEIIVEMCFRAPSSIVTTATNLHPVLENARRSLQNRIDDFTEHGSGWRVNEILCADVEMGTCAALNGSCNLVSIDYLKSVVTTKRTTDTQQCFLHACAFHFVKTDNVYKLNKFIKKFFIVKIASPVRVKDIPRFERDNFHLKLKINVIYLEEKKVYPLIFSKKLDADHHINLLLYKTEVGGKVVSHYAYVKDVSKLLRKCYIKDGRYSYEKSISCLNCFTKFCAQGRGEQNLERHYEHCSKNKPQAVQIPAEGSTLHFKNHLDKFPSHFVGYFDFESCHLKQEFECTKCQMVTEGSNAACHHKTLTKAVQQPITYSYLILDKNGVIVFNNTYTGRDCVKKFLEELISIEEDLLAVLNANIALNMSAADEELFAAASECHICEKELDGDSVRDHCHVSGKFLGAAHNVCNLGRVERKTIPMFCHNLTG